MDYLSRPAERLVLSGYRNVMAAYEFADVSCWEAVWQEYIALAGTGPARHLVGELQYWGRCLRQTAGRELRFFPACCRRLCHDDCVRRRGQR